MGNNILLDIDNIIRVKYLVFFFFGGLLVFSIFYSFIVKKIYLRRGFSVSLTSGIFLAGISFFLSYVVAASCTRFTTPIESIFNKSILILLFLSSLGLVLTIISFNLLINHEKSFVRIFGGIFLLIIALLLFLFTPFLNGLACD